MRPDRQYALPMGRDGLSVLVLHEAVSADARPDEKDALTQVAEVSGAMRQLGWQVRALPTGLDLAATLSSISDHGAACVFNLVEALAGDGRMVHFVPTLLRAMNLPFTGSDSDAVYLSSQKLLAKRWMRLNGIPTPPCFVAGGEPCDNDETWIVKSVWEHASFGLDDGCVVTGTDAANARIDACTRQYGGDWFAERYIDGREFNISVLERRGQPYILPMAEMAFVDYPHGKPRIVGYAAKWDQTAPEYHATLRIFPDVPGRLREPLLKIVRRCWEIFGLKGYARVDVRVDSKGTPWVLEINANPCLSRDAGYAAAALQAGMTYEQVVACIVQAALRVQSETARRAGAAPIGLTAAPGSVGDV